MSQKFKNQNWQIGKSQCDDRYPNIHRAEVIKLYSSGQTWTCPFMTCELRWVFTFRRGWRVIKGRRIFCDVWILYEIWILVFLNNVLVEYSHDHSCVNYLGLRSCRTAKLSGFHGSQSLKYLLFGSLQKVCPACYRISGLSNDPFHKQHQKVYQISTITQLKGTTNEARLHNTESPPVPWVIVCYNNIQKLYQWYIFWKIWKILKSMQKKV